MKTNTQMGLFGEETVRSSLFLERAKVLDKALKKLRQGAKVFDSLVRNGQPQGGLVRCLNRSRKEGRR